MAKQKNYPYEIRFIEEVTYSNNEVAGGDDHFIDCYKTEKEALKEAKKLSLNTKTFFKGTKILHEVLVRRENLDEDSVENWYIKNGKITHHDKG